MPTSWLAACRQAAAAGAGPSGRGHEVLGRDASLPVDADLDQVVVDPGVVPGNGEQGRLLDRPGDDALGHPRPAHEQTGETTAQRGRAG